MLDTRQPIVPAAALCCVCLAGLGQAGLPLGPLQVPLGLGVVLLAPGFGLLRVLQLPRRSPYPLVILSMPLSLALAVTAGVALDATGTGVHPATLASALEVLAAPLLVLALWRERRGLLPALRRLRLRRPGRLATRHSAMLAGAFMAASAWTGAGLLRASADDPPPFTELAVSQVSPATLLSDSPSRLALQLTVSNQEPGSLSYRLAVQVRTPGGRTIPAADRKLRVAPGRLWAGRVVVPFSCGDQIKAQLFLRGSAAVYRWVQVRPHCPPSSPTPALQAARLSRYPGAGSCPVQPGTSRGGSADVCTSR